MSKNVPTTGELIVDKFKQSLHMQELLLNSSLVYLAKLIDDELDGREKVFNDILESRNKLDDELHQQHGIK